MALAHMLPDPSSIMTVISLATFLGILWWTFVTKRSADFDVAANLPFADETEAEAGKQDTEQDHV